MRRPRPFNTTSRCWPVVASGCGAATMRVIMTSRTDCGQLPVGGRLGGQGGRLTQDAGAAVAASQVYEKMGCAGLLATFCTKGTSAVAPVNALAGSVLDAFWATP